MVYYLKRVAKLPISIKQTSDAWNVQEVGSFPPRVPPFFGMAEVLTAVLFNMTGKNIYKYTQLLIVILHFDIIQAREALPIDGQP